MLGADEKKAKKQKGWRIEADLADYITKLGARAGEVNVIEDCIRLHRTLNEVLDGHGKQLDDYAAKNALTMRDHWSAVIARLVLAGLEAESRRK